MWLRNVLGGEAVSRALGGEAVSRALGGEVVSRDLEVRRSLAEYSQVGCLSHVNFRTDCPRSSPLSHATPRSACFSGDGEHVIGASAGKAVRNLYIWNRIHGKMERILEGAKPGPL